MTMEEQVIKQLGQSDPPVVGPRLGEFLSATGPGRVYAFTSTAENMVPPYRVLSVCFAQGDYEPEFCGEFIMQ
jgi:hypothetical protein